MKKILLLGFFVLLSQISLAQAQTRTWAISKDTVYEWNPNGDSTSITNNGIDTLKIDSIGLEPILFTANRFETGFYFNSGAGDHMIVMTYSQGTQIYPNGQNAIMPVVNPATVSRLFDFKIEDQLVRLVKSAAISQGDTLTVRLIFVAAAGRGRDTLIFKGKQDLPVGLRAAQDAFRKLDPDDRLFDLRGRHVDKIPEGLKVPWAPVVRQKE